MPSIPGIREIAWLTRTALPWPSSLSAASIWSSWACTLARRRVWRHRRWRRSAVPKRWVTKFRALKCDGWSDFATRIWPPTLRSRLRQPSTTTCPGWLSTRGSSAALPSLPGKATNSHLTRWPKPSPGFSGYSRTLSRVKSWPLRHAPTSPSEFWSKLLFAGALK